MITIISGTNRVASRTKIVADFCKEILAQHHQVQVLDLSIISKDIIHEDMYAANGMHSSLVPIIDQYISKTKLWVIVSPEYNGSFPGILKLFIDAISIHSLKDIFHDKKVALIGTSTGRAGNLRGMEHLTSLLNYLKVNVFYDKLPISSIHQHVENGVMSEETQKVISLFLKDFVAWSSK